MKSTESRGAGFDDEAVEALLSGDPAAAEDPLAAVLAALRAAAVLSAPEPSPALAALFTAGLPLAERARQRRRRRTIVTGAVIAGASSLTLCGVAAAHDALPGPAQRVMTGIINTVTPFHIDGPGPGTSRPAPAVPAPAVVSAPVSSAVTVANDGGKGASTGDRSGSGDSPRSGSGRDASGDQPAPTPTTSSSSGGSDGGGPGSDGGSSGGGGSVTSSPSPSVSATSDGGGGGSDGGGSGGGTDGGGGSSDGDG
jgi:hypothetical protein